VVPRADFITPAPAGQGGGDQRSVCSARRSSRFGVSAGLVGASGRASASPWTRKLFANVLRFKRIALYPDSQDRPDRPRSTCVRVGRHPSRGAWHSSFEGRLWSVASRVRRTREDPFDRGNRSASWHEDAASCLLATRRSPRGRAHELAGGVIDLFSPDSRQRTTCPGGPRISLYRRSKP